MNRQLAIVALGLWVGACGSDMGGEAGTNQAAADAAVANSQVAADNDATSNTASADAAPASAGMPACPFINARDFQGSIESGRLLINGQVDAIMAGYTPSVARRPGAAAGVTALDLTMNPEPGDIVNLPVRYEESGAARTPRGEVWCGGERIAEFDMVLVAE